MRLGARVCVCVSTCAARLLCACAARLLRGKCLMLVRHAACASVWACAGQRHFVPRTYPGHTKSPLSVHPTAVTVWLLLEWREGIPTHCAADRLKTRRCIAVSPNRRAAQRPAPSKPVSHPVTHHLLARCQAWGLHHPIHAAAALFGEDNLPLSVNQAFHPYHTT